MFPMSLSSYTLSSPLSSLSSPVKDVNDVEFIGSNRLKMLADNYLQTHQFINRNMEVRQCVSDDVKIIGNDDSEMIFTSEKRTKPKLSFSIEAIIGIK